MKTAIERFNSKWKADANGCHVWQAANDGHGYGKFRHKMRLYSAHRWALQFIAGVELVEGLQCDHICNNPSCVNPAHLRQCTARENSMALHSKTNVRLRSEQTHCKNGCALSGENLVVQRNGTRKCKRCANKISREWYHAHKKLKAQP